MRVIIFIIHFSIGQLPDSPKNSENDAPKKNTFIKKDDSEDDESPKSDRDSKSEKEEDEEKEEEEEKDEKTKSLKKAELKKVKSSPPTKKSPKIINSFFGKNYPIASTFSSIYADLLL